MFKVTVQENQDKKIVKMRDMQPLQVGIVCGTLSDSVVMRTASTSKFEVIDLSKPVPESCWTSKENAGLFVHILPPGTRLIIDIE